MLKPRPAPTTPRAWALYRATLSCKLGRDALDGKTPVVTCTPMEYALYNLLHAVEEIARALGEREGEGT